MFGKPLRLALALALLAFGNACSHGGHDTAPFAGASDAGDHQPVPTVDPCETPNKGCACENADEVIDCGQVERLSGDYVSCTMGKRTCEGNNTWGECVGDRIATLSVPAGGKRTQGLGTSKACIDNPCDPYCQRIVDDAAGLNLDGGPVHQRWRADDEADHSAARGHRLLEPLDHAGHAGHHDLCAEFCVREGRILQSDQQDRHLDSFHLDGDGDSHRSEHQQQLQRCGYPVQPASPRPTSPCAGLARSSPPRPRPIPFTLRQTTAFGSGSTARWSSINGRIRAPPNTLPRRST